jgi:O-antigen/teichoic acid export membrane protein
MSGTQPQAEHEPPDQPLRRRAVVGGLWTGLQYFYANAASTVAFIVLARLIAPASFGLVSLASVFVAIVLLLSDLGVTPALTRAETVTATTLSTGFWLGMALSVMLCAGLELVSAPVSAWLHEPALTPILRVLALSVPVNSLCAVPTAILSRELKMRPQAMRQVLASSIATVGAIVMAFAGFGVWSLVFQDCGTIALEAYVLWRAVTWRPQLLFARNEAKTLLGFGIKVTLTEIVGQGRARGIELLIGRLLGTRALGFWVIATRISGLAVSMFASAINAVALPAFAQVARQPERLHRAIRHSVRVCATAALPGLLAIAAMSPYLIPFLFGPHWRTTADIAQITAATAGLIAFQWLDGNIWWALGRPGVEFRLVCGISLADLVLVWFFSHYGLDAIALALLARAFISIPIRLLTVVKLGHIPASCYQDLPVIAAVSGAMYVSMRLVGFEIDHAPQIIVIAVQVIAAAISYLGLSWVVQRDNLIEFVRDLKHVSGRV